MRTHRVITPIALLLLALTLASPSWARKARPERKPAPTVTQDAASQALEELASSPAAGAAVDVVVEPVKPENPKHVTLEFLKENRAFIRARFDRLREKPREIRASSAEVDPRFTAYRQLLADALGARDSVQAAEAAGNRRALFDRAEQLVDLETELDQLERVLTDQRGRLAVLQRDFTGSQKTELVVVLSGWPGRVAPQELTIQLENRVTITVALDDNQREILVRGGLVQVLHERVEPRSQVVEVALGGGSWPQTKRGFLTLEPAHDRLNFLRLDLAGARPDRNSGAIQARTWHVDVRPARAG